MKIEHLQIGSHPISYIVSLIVF